MGVAPGVSRRRRVVYIDEATHREKTQQQDGSADDDLGAQPHVGPRGESGAGVLFEVGHGRRQGFFRAHQERLVASDGVEENGGAHLVPPAGTGAVGRAAQHQLGVVAVDAQLRMARS